MARTDRTPPRPPPPARAADPRSPGPTSPAAVAAAQAIEGGGEPNYFSEAFFHPVNKISLAGFAVLGLMASGFLWLGAAFELAYLALVPSDPRFQRSCRAKRLGAKLEDLPAIAERLVRELSVQAQRRYRELEALIQTIESRKDTVDPASLVLMEGSVGKLDYLLFGYLRMLHAADHLEGYLAQTDHDEILDSARKLRDEMDQTASARVRQVKQRNLEILDERVKRYHQAGEELSYLKANLSAAEDTVRLVRDRVVSTGTLGTALGELDLVLEDLKQGEHLMAAVDPIDELERPAETIDTGAPVEPAREYALSEAMPEPEPGDDPLADRRTKVGEPGKGGG